MINYGMRIAEAKYHFIGVGGIGMCGLAELMHTLGAQVTGSDPADNQQIEHLKKLGIKVYSSHSETNLGDADVVVYSSAIKASNPELAEAKRKKIPIIARAEALAELMRLKRGIAVAGTHGKTTTTSLLASAFIAARQDPTIVVGGRLKILGSTAAWGRGPWMIAEADESDGSFKKLSPEIIVITNIDNDHLDFYGSFDNVKKAFLDFAEHVPFYGFVLACGDDPNVREVFSNFSKPVKFYGFGEGNDFQIVPEGAEYFVRYKGKKISRVHTGMPGIHNILNATVAVAIANELGLPLDLVRMGIENFAGVDRRAQWKGQRGGVDVYDDYGHHPTEVQATIKGFREKFSGRKLVVCFQPHRYSRTKLCWSQFLTAFSEADEVWITDIYAAGEASEEGITAERLAKEIKHSNCRYIGRRDLGSAKLEQMLRGGEIFLTLGAGDGWKIGMEYLESKNRGAI